MDSKEKYLKYKNKYISFKNMIGGDLGKWEGVWDGVWTDGKFKGTYRGTFTNSNYPTIPLKVPEIVGTWEGTWKDEVFEGKYKSDDGSIVLSDSKRVGEFNGKDNFEGLSYDDKGKKTTMNIFKKKNSWDNDIVPNEQYTLKSFLDYYKLRDNNIYWDEDKIENIYNNFLLNFNDFEIFYFSDIIENQTLLFSIIKNVLIIKSKKDIIKFTSVIGYDDFLKKYITDEKLCNKIINTPYIPLYIPLKYTIDVLKNLAVFYNYNIIYLELEEYKGNITYFPFIPGVNAVDFINKTGDTNKMTISKNYFYKKQSIIIYKHIYKSLYSGKIIKFHVLLYNKDDSIMYSSINKIVSECNFITDFKQYCEPNEDFQTK